MRQGPGLLHAPATARLQQHRLGRPPPHDDAPPVSPSHDDAPPVSPPHNSRAARLHRPRRPRPDEAHGVPHEGNPGAVQGTHEDPQSLEYPQPVHRIDGAAPRVRPTTCPPLRRPLHQEVLAYKLLFSSFSYQPFVVLVVRVMPWLLYVSVCVAFGVFGDECRASKALRPVVERCA